MLAVYGKIQFLGRQSISNLKNVDFRAVRFSAIFTSRNSIDEFSRSSSQLGSSPLLLSCREYGTQTEYLLPSMINGIAPKAKLCRAPNPSLSQPSVVMPIRRFMATMENSVEPGTLDASASMSDVPPRIKFKRPDKTARHIMQILDKEAVEEVKSSREMPDIRPGYIVQLKVEVPENKRRVSTIKGIVIARRNAGLNTTFRIRRLVAGVGVESLFPLYSPNIKEIKVLEKKRVRRAKLYYLRDKMNALKKQ